MGDASNDIPIGLLEKSIKLTNEPPQGLKDNLKRAFSFFKKEEIEDKDPKIKTILFGLSTSIPSCASVVSSELRAGTDSTPSQLVTCVTPALCSRTTWITIRLPARFHGTILSTCSVRSCTVVTSLMTGIDVSALSSWTT